MGFRQGAYAKVWEITPAENGKTTSINISISKKNKETGEYEKEFSNKVVCIGEANTMAQEKLVKGAKIKIGDCDCSSWWNKEKETMFYKFKIFSFELADSTTTSSSGGGSYPFGDFESKVEEAVDKAAEEESSADNQMPF